MPAERKSPFEGHTPENGKPFEYAWTFLGRRFRAVEAQPGIVRYFATEEDSDHARYSPIDRPLGLTNELVHLSRATDALLLQRDELAEALRWVHDYLDGFPPPKQENVDRIIDHTRAALAKLDEGEEGR